MRRVATGLVRDVVGSGAAGGRRHDRQGEDEAEQVRKRLAEALGAEPRIAFRADPDLVAGIEVAGPHLTVSNSWRDGLARMRGEITADG